MLLNFFLAISGISTGITYLGGKQARHSLGVQAIAEVKVGRTEEPGSL